MKSAQKMITQLLRSLKILSTKQPMQPITPLPDAGSARSCWGVRTMSTCTQLLHKPRKASLQETNHYGSINRHFYSRIQQLLPIKFWSTQFVASTLRHNELNLQEDWTTNAAASRQYAAHPKQQHASPPFQDTAQTAPQPYRVKAVCEPHVLESHEHGT